MNKITMSGELKNLIPALLKAQQEIKPAVQDARNPHFQNRYATFQSVQQACKGPLLANGLCLVQTMSGDDSGNSYLNTTLFHTSGEWISGGLRLLVDQPSMQKLGSAITYAKRYSLAAMLGVVDDEDDDGNKASAPEPYKSAQPTQINRAPQQQSLRSVAGQPVPQQPNIGNPGAYRINFGKKYKGKAINEISQDDLRNYIGWIETEVTPEKPMSPEALELVRHFDAYYGAPVTHPSAPAASGMLKEIPMPTDQDMPAFHSDDVPF